MIVLLGKNGSGKTYLAKELQKQGYNYTPNYTTREKRSNEVDGIDYKFVSKCEFEYLISQGFFAEYKIFNNNYYGTPVSKLAKDAITIGGNLEILKQQSDYDIKPVFIYSDIAKRFSRIMARCEPSQELFNRMHAENFDYIDDFEAIFIDNSHEQGLPLLTDAVTINGEINEGLITSSDEFFSGLPSEKSSDQNELLSFLRYEEMLLIGMKKLVAKYDERKLFDFYVAALMEYANNHDITFVPYANQTFSLTCEDQKYHGEFLIRSLKRK